MRKIDSTEIASLRGLALTLERDSRKKIIADYMKKGIITPEFVSEFSDLIEKEAFSNSAQLSLDLIQRYPDLFVKEIWIQNKSKSLEPLLNKEFRKQFSEEEIYNILDNSMRAEFTREFFNNGKDLLKIKNVGQLLISKAIFEITEVLSEDDIMNIVLNSSGNPFSGKLRDFLNQERTEKVFKNREIDFLSFITGLLHKNMSWQNRMIREALSGEINIDKTTGTADNLMCEIILSLDTNILSNFIELAKEKAPNALSFYVLNYLLSVKEVDEDFCLQNIEIFKNQNLLKALGEYCKNHDYETALLAICV